MQMAPGLKVPHDPMHGCACIPLIHSLFKSVREYYRYQHECCGSLSCNKAIGEHNFDILSFVVGLAPCSILPRVPSVATREYRGHITLIGLDTHVAAHAVPST